MSMTRLSPKVLILIAIAGVAAILVYPGLLRVLPIVLVALICPLMMVLMGGHAGHSAHRNGQASKEGLNGGEYTCPMHSDVHSNALGRCPKCGMALAAPSREEQIARLTSEFESVRERQSALAREIERLHAQEAAGSPSSALAEAEEIARAADTQKERPDETS